MSYGYNSAGLYRGEGYTNSLGLLGHFSIISNQLIAIAPIAEAEVVNASSMMAIGENIDGGMSFERSDFFLGNN